jgi:predicted amidophosphoribosyltransferase
LIVRAVALSTAVADGLLAVILSPACAVCEMPLEHPATQVVCDACWGGIARITPPVCTRCGDALPSWRTASLAAGLCPRCRRMPSPALDHQRAAGQYDGPLRDIVHAWKYGPRRSLVEPIGELVREVAGELRQTSDAVVPVPLHRSRRRERGFNQAEDLARRIGLPMLPALRRVRRTPPQAPLTAAARRRNVRGAFALAPMPLGRSLREGGVGGWRLALRRKGRVTLMRAEIAGRRLLLVDDVSTTGATLEACAAVLKEAGASAVTAVTAARAVHVRRR